MALRSLPAFGGDYTAKKRWVNIPFHWVSLSGICTIRAIRLNTISDRAYKYIVDEFKKDISSVTFKELRDRAYENATKDPSVYLIANTKSFDRKEFIKAYALARSQGKCEGCENYAPFLKRNGEPYLEVHHLIELGDNGSDSPSNVAALCPNCHARITHGLDGAEFNRKLTKKIREIENLIE